MKKKIVLSLVMVLSCLVVLFGTFLVLPKSPAHAAGTSSKSTKVAAPTLSVSPTSITNSTHCTQFEVDPAVGYPDYQVCSITLTLSHPVSGSIKWTFSYSATFCSNPSCEPEYDLASLPSQGSIENTYTVGVITPANLEHGLIKGKVVFSTPTSKASVDIMLTENCC